MLSCVAVMALYYLGVFYLYVMQPDASFVECMVSLIICDLLMSLFSRVLLEDYFK